MSICFDGKAVGEVKEVELPKVDWGKGVSKSILVIVTPAECAECELKECSFKNAYCIVKNHRTVPEDGKPDWCPLQELPEPVRIVECETQKVSACMTIDKGVPAEVTKRQIARKLAEELEPFIEWDFRDAPDTYPYKKQVRADVYLARR